MLGSKSDASISNLLWLETDWCAMVFSSFSEMQGLLDRWSEVRKNLPNPGSYEQLHREVKMMFPTNHMIEGVKVDLASLLSQSFISSHSISWGSQEQPPAYHFTSIYSTPSFGLHGTVDHDGTLQARGNYNWIPQPQQQHMDQVQEEVDAVQEPKPTSTSKFQIQLGSQGQNMTILEHEYVGSDFSVTAKAINPHPFDAPPSWNPSKKLNVTGVYTLSYLQSISRSFAIGMELTHQKPSAEFEDTNMSYVLRYAPPAQPLPKPSSYPPDLDVPFPHFNPKHATQVFTTQWQPAQGLLHSTYWRRLNPRLEVGTELQLLMTPAVGGQPGKRNGIASAGFKLDTVWATIRAMFTSAGTLSCVLEERIVPGVSFTICSEMNYAQGRGGVGKVGFGFTLEA
ncbi:eukaryotic porin-domain-containing protein [Gorgonomyces haynaldii]|nr:eukaryotic porin-domain-containing protein [Gorgonomyces haynaldii]